MTENNSTTPNFKDKVVIDGKTILEIPIENMLYEDKPLEFKSKWSMKEDNIRIKSKFNRLDNKTNHMNANDIVFDPLKAMMKPEMKLAICADTDPETTNRGRSKWGEEWEKTFHPPPLNRIPPHLSLEEVEYLIRLHRLDDLNKKQQTGFMEVPDPEIRSPSPEPIYDQMGKRINTLEQRIKNEMIMEKNTLIEECQRMNIGFMTPYDWKPMKKSRKIYLPEYDNAELNFVSLVIGHKGRTQRVLEEKSGCRISVQGRMASQNKRPGQSMDEQTHVLIQAETEKELNIGCDMVQAVLNGDSINGFGINNGNNFLQNGTELVAVEALLRDFCENCREEGHKPWACPYIYNDDLAPKTINNGIMTNVYTDLKCEICGDKSHPTKDCPEKRMKDLETVMKLNKEYVDFKKELGGESEFGDLFTSNNNNSNFRNGQTNFITAGLNDKMIEDNKKNMKFMIEN